jgi:Spy/CpxP family protein refolding chaperone
MPEVAPEAAVRHTITVIVVVCVLAISGRSEPAAQQPVPAAASNTPPSIDEVLKAVRGDLQSNRTDMVAKNVTLTAEQAAKFWPLFVAYQKEQNVIMDEQMKGIQTYAENAEKLDDAGALALINAHIDRDAKMAALRRHWLGEFQKALPAKQAARVMQIDRRLSLAHQVEFASRIPLVH